MLGLTVDILVPSGCELDLLKCGTVMRLVGRHNHHLGEAELLVDSLTENEEHLLICTQTHISKACLTESAHIVH